MNKIQPENRCTKPDPACKLIAVLFSLACILLTGKNAFAQPDNLWDRTIGGSDTDRLYTATPTQDGGYILGGHTRSQADGNVTGASRGEEDYWLVKITSLGYKEWDKVIGGPQADYLRSVVQTSDGGYILAGHSFSGKGGDKSQNNRGENSPDEPLTSDYWIVKVSADGNKEWDKTIGSTKTEELNAVIQTADGGYLLGGTSDSPVGGEKTASSSGRDFWIVKLASNGSRQWDKTYGGAKREDLADIKQTSDGGYILGGSTFSAAGSGVTTGSKGGSDYWLVKTSSNGTKQWDKTYGGMQTDKMNRLQVTSDNGFILGGYSNSAISGDKSESAVNGFNDYWIIKVQDNGSRQWDKTFGGQNGHSVLTSLIQTSDGGYAIGGHSAASQGRAMSYGTQGGDDFWLLKLSANGSKTWDKTFGGTGTDQLRVIMENYGALMVAGTSNSPNGYYKTENQKGSDGKDDFWLVSLDSQERTGYLSWAQSSLSFQVDPASPAASESAYLITGNGEFVYATLIKTDDTPWLDLPPGTVGSTSFWVDASGMSPGTYTATVTAFAPGYFSARLDITLYIDGDDPAKRFVRINAGGPDFTSTDGRTFMTDQFYSGIDRVSSISGGEILNTTDDALYRTGRSSPSFGYHIPVSSGTVNVVLHFAEIWYGAPGRGPGGAGKRQFHVTIEGSRKLTNFDIFAAAGGAMRAITRTFPVTVTDGFLNIDLISGAADMPRLSAIEIVTTQLEVPAIADAYVREGYYYDNFGAEPELNVKNTPENVEPRRSAYLKFVVPESVAAGSAKLRIYGRNRENAKGVLLHVYGVDDDKWAENTISQSDAPVAREQSIGSVSVNQVQKYYEFDVTSFVKAQQQTGDAIVSFKLNDPANRNLRLVFNSRENALHPPQLVIQAAPTSSPAARTGREGSLAENVSPETSSVYPNPVSDHMTVGVALSHSGKTDLSLVSANGQEIPVFSSLEPQPGKSADIDVSHLNAGLYMLRIQSAKKAESIKVMIGKP
ncbi:CBM96 family carbohydrate-binding protein [Dyadobacter sediminis]|uniref:DNRLRE domain-containing protein n=1 Tax=Dyadobacter sediminis TaxID=1493691 RepID=A0A5R9KIY9_9BACT|nr:malectin domain-containing carbohydrate-binding protein [Dyadobacter sediminis]TLU96089.1 DNRLRE domain-containing protein [Dyadobacter sediminis]GGB79144.1 hypothetical protein GCM10011325_03370 [Dyadobacter sediminis]